MHWERCPAKDVKDLSFNATFVDSNSSCASILGLSPYVTKYQKISFLHFCILQMIKKLEQERPARNYHQLCKSLVLHPDCMLGDKVGWGRHLTHFL